MRTFLIIGFICISLYCKAQPVKQVTSVKQIWLAYINQGQLAQHWGTWFALQLRTRDQFTNGFSQFMIQGGISYLTDKIRCTAGYTFVNYFPADNHPFISRPEHRPWQLILLNSAHSKLKVNQSVRLEERWRRKIASESTLAKGYNFNYRIGYNLQLNFPLSKRGLVSNTLSLIANNDLQINFGKEIVYNYFDQNRIFFGLNYLTMHKSNLQFGYLGGFQQLSGGSKYRKLSAIRVFYFHNLNLRRNAKITEKPIEAQGQ